MKEDEILAQLAQSVEDGEPEDAVALSQQALDMGLGTVKGDLHEIGKTLVGTMLTANGFQVTDIGIDKSADEFIEAIAENKADLVGMSALLTTTMREQQTIINAIKEAGLRDQVKVMVGGAPVTQDWAQQIGADGYAEDAISAIDLAYRLIDAPA
jgi:5-methyltetrahydrofolate--homocysteine methyltransferase